MAGPVKVMAVPDETEFVNSSAGPIPFSAGSSDWIFDDQTKRKEGSKLPVGPVAPYPYTKILNYKLTFFFLRSI